MTLNNLHKLLFLVRNINQVCRRCFVLNQLNRNFRNGRGWRTANNILGSRKFWSIVLSLPRQNWIRKIVMSFWNSLVQSRGRLVKISTSHMLNLQYCSYLWDTDYLQFLGLSVHFGTSFPFCGELWLFLLLSTTCQSFLAYREQTNVDPLGVVFLPVCLRELFLGFLPNAYWFLQESSKVVRGNGLHRGQSHYVSSLCDRLLTCMFYRTPRVVAVGCRSDPVSAWWFEGFWPGCSAAARWPKLQASVLRRSTARCSRWATGRRPVEWRMA